MEQKDKNGSSNKIVFIVQIKFEMSSK